MMGPTTVAVITAALAHAALATATSGSTIVRGAVPAGSTAPSAASASMFPDAPVNGRVSRISVGPATDGAEIMIAVDSGVTVRHFTLDGPSRLVVDLGGASLALRGAGYDGQARGPIRNVRLSQFRPDTVRLVIDLDASRQYSVKQTGTQVRVTVDGPAVSVASWETKSIGSSVGSASAQSAAGRLDTALPVDAPATVTAAPRTEATTNGFGSLAEQAKTQRTENNELREQIAVLTAASDAAARETARKDAKAIADAPMEGRAAPASRRSVTQTQQQPKPRITVGYDGIDIRDVIAAFASFSGRTIVVGKEVSGLVSADINDKPWDVALQAILQAQGLAATEDASGIITVDSYRNLASNQALEPMVTQIVDVNYAKATTLRQTVQALLARDCTGLSTMATGRELGVPMNQQGGGGGQNAGNGITGQGCVVRGSVAADSATNKLIITETPSRLPEIVARLQELDIRTPQVAIKAKIIFVNRTGITDIGLAYDLGTGNKQFFQQLVPRTDPSTLVPIDTDGDGVPDATGGGSPFQGPARIALGGNAIAGIANANNAIKPNALNLIYSTALGRYQLTAFLNALQTSSLADVQSEPSVTILNNRTAQIFVGQEIPIRVIDAGGQGAQGGGGGGGGGAQGQPNAAAFFPRAAVSKEEAGIKLTVTPQITNNRMVLLDIQAENSSAELANTDVGVVFNRQRADSKVLVADGEAAVIGGLTVTETTRFRSGIPVLMNLPFIGRLFSQNTTNETKRDLLILVTPHILEDGTTPPPGR